MSCVDSPEEQNNKYSNYGAMICINMEFTALFPVGKHIGHKCEK